MKAVKTRKARTPKRKTFHGHIEVSAAELPWRILQLLAVFVSKSSPQKGR